MQAVDALLGALAEHRRIFRAIQLKVIAGALLNKAAGADGLDRRLAAGYRDRARAFHQEAAELESRNHQSPGYRAS